MSNIVIVNGINVIEELEKAQQALIELEELKRDVEEYTRLQQLHIDCKPHNDFRRMDLFRKLSKVGIKK